MSDKELVERLRLIERTLEEHRDQIAGHRREITDLRAELKSVRERQPILDVRGRSL